MRRYFKGFAKAIVTFPMVIAAAIAIAAIPQPAKAVATWPLGPYTLTANTTLASCAATGCVSIGLSGDPGYANCSVTAASTATFGGGTLTAYVSADGLAADATAVSGQGNVGNPSAPVSTMTAAGTLTFPVAGHYTLYVVLTGATSPSIPVYVMCSRGTASSSAVYAAPAPTGPNGGISMAGGLCTSAVFCSPPIGDTPFSQAVTTTLTQVIAAPASGSIRITSIQALGEESATGGFMELEYGTGTNCGTGTTLLNILLYLNTTAGAAQQMSWGTGAGSVIIVPATKALCVVISAGTVTAAQLAGTYAVW